LRINDQNPIKEIWKASMNGRAAFPPKRRRVHANLAGQWKSDDQDHATDGKVKEGDFDLGAVSDVRIKIAYACD
jgi:hypothetical protein